MKINKISLKNGYKRFKELTIDLTSSHPKIVALIGPNGCGKSSVFDGMLFKATSYSPIGQFGRKSGQFHSMDSLPEFNQANIEIHFDTGTFESVYSAKQATGKQSTIFSFRNAYRFNSNLNITQLQAVSDLRLNNVGASSSVDLDDKMTQNYQRLYVHLNDYRRKYNLTDLAAQEKVIGELNKILEACLDLKIAHEGDILGNKGSLFFKKKNQQKEFDFNVLSAGEREVVDILLDIFLKKDEFNETIYIIDEPELHLNTSIQKKLLIEIEKIIPDSCQLWVATHSVGFLNALQNDLNSKCEVIHFDQDYSQTPVTLTPIKKTRENWRKIFQIALEDLTGLIAPKKVIYCEGRKDTTPENKELGLDAIVYNRVFAESHQDSFFVSAGGNTEVDKHAGFGLLILTKAFDGVDVYVLRDKDINSDGSQTTDVQRSEWLEKDKKRRMLKRREIENYLLDFEIVSKKFQNLTETDHKSIIPEIINADVKEKVSALMTAVNFNGRGMDSRKFLLELSKEITPDTKIYNELKACIFDS